MPKKSILISSGSAKRTAVPNNAFTYDTDTQYVSIDNLSASQFTVANAVSGILISSGGVITAYPANGYPDAYLATDGTKWVVGSAGIVSIGNVSGTLTGSYPNPKFIDISNVNTGSLPVARGGLSGSGNYNLLSSITSGSLIIASGTGSLAVVSTASYSSTGDAWVLASVSGTTQWAAVTASAPERDVNVQYFTCSASTVTTTGSWIKQNPNHQWARIMLQAGGGGGGGSALYTGSACSGGGAGGFTDITIYVGNINSALITVGGGSSGAQTIARAATASSSSFSASNIFVSALGGQGGAGSSGVGGSGGIGLTYDGADGGNYNSAVLDGIGAGGGCGGMAFSSNFTGGTSGLYLTNTLGGQVGYGASASGSYKPNLYGYTLPIGFGSGGGGAKTDAPTGNYWPAGNGIYGSGGGGGGVASTGAINAYGGNGGGGFVIVISY